MESVFSGQARAGGDASNLPPGVRPFAETRSGAQRDLLANLPPAVRQNDRKKRGAQNDTMIIDNTENILEKYSPFLIISMLVNHKLGCPRCVNQFSVNVFIDESHYEQSNMFNYLEFILSRIFKS